MQITPEWQSAIEDILSSPGVTVVVGATDSGKTTFCLQLLNAAAHANVPCSLVDSDVGQSVIGPPGTVGLAEITKEFESFDALEAQRLYFVGSTSPANHLLPTIIGTKRLVDIARSRKVNLVLVDTSGLVRGVMGRKLKSYKLDLLQPKHLVAIQRSYEIDYLIKSFAKSSVTKLHSLRVPSAAVRKPQQYRAMRRRSMFYNAFSSAEGHLIRLDQVAFRNTFFSTGKPLHWQHIRTIEDILAQRVLHAESIGKGLYVVIEGQVEKRREIHLMEHYNTREISIIPASAFQNVLLGFLDASGFCLGIGLLQAVDFKQNYMFILSKIRTISPVKIVQFGSMRVRPDGTELGRIISGEI